MLCWKFLQSSIFSFQKKNFQLCQNLLTELIKFIIDNDASKLKADAFGNFLFNRTIVIQKVSVTFINNIDYFFYVKLEQIGDPKLTSLIKEVQKNEGDIIPNKKLNEEDLQGNLIYSCYVLSFDAELVKSLSSKALKSKNTTKKVVQQECKSGKEEEKEEEENDEEEEVEQQLPEKRRKHKVYILYCVNSQYLHY